MTKSNLERRLFKQLKKRNKKGFSYDDFASLFDSYRGIYEDYLSNLVMNLITYKNAPDSLNQQGLEFMLRYYGYANLVGIDKDNIYIEGVGLDYPEINFTFGTIMGGLNQTQDSQYIKDITQGKNVKMLTRMNAKTVKAPAYVTLTNKYSYYLGNNVSDIEVIQQTARTLAEIKASIITNVRQQKTPFIGFTKDNNLSTKNIWYQIESGKPFIQVDGEAYSNDIKKAITTIPVQVPNLSATLQDSWNNALNEFLTMLGIDNVAVDKKERLVSAEADSNDAQVSASMGVYLNARNSQLKLLNDCLGTNIKAEINMGTINKLNNLNMADTGTGTKTGESKEENSDGNVND